MKSRIHRLKALYVWSTLLISHFHSLVRSGFFSTDALLDKKYLEFNGTWLYQQGNKIKSAFAYRQISTAVGSKPVMDRTVEYPENRICDILRRIFQVDPATKELRSLRVDKELSGLARAPIRTTSVFSRQLQKHFLRNPTFYTYQRKSLDIIITQMCHLLPQRLFLFFRSMPLIVSGADF